MNHLSALIVDSSPSYAQTVACCLKDLGLAHDNIFISRKYEAALDLLKSKKPQLLITEFSIDGKYGLQLISQHTSHSPHNISVIMTHNNSSTSIAEAAEELVDDYIVKPFQSGNLYERLKNLINRKLNPNEYIKAIRDGKQMLLEGRLDDAELNFKTAARLENRPTLAYYYLGYTNFVDHKLNIAAGEFAKGLSIQPLHYKCLTGKFDTLFEQRSYEDAYTIASTIVDNYPIGPKRLGQLFISAVFSGKLDVVPEYYKLFAQLDHKPNELRRVFSAALFTAGRSQINHNDLPKAIECFEMGIQVVGPDIEYITKIVKVLLKTDSNGHRQAARILNLFPNLKVGSREFNILQFQVNAKLLPTSQIIEQGRKLAASRQLDEECYVEFIKILIADNKIVLAEDIAGKALREYPGLRETVNGILKMGDKNTASEKN
ncbi:MAG: response regulator [Bacillota bacterium]